MTDVPVKAPFAFDIPVAQLAQVKGEVAVVPPKADIVAELTTNRVLVKGLVDDYARITKGRVSFESTAMQAPYAWCKKIGLTGLRTALFAPGGAIVGLFAGAAVVSASSSVANALFFTITAAGIAAPLLAGAAVALSKLDIAQRKEKYIQLEGPLEDVVSRFHASEGAERTLLGSTLEDWLTDFDARKALSPEARVALVDAQEANEDVGMAAIRRVERLSSINKFMAETDQVTATHVEGLKWTLGQFSPEERAQLALVIINHVRNSGRKIEYQAGHDLYGYLLHVAAESSLAAATVSEHSGLQDEPHPSRPL